MSPSTRIVSVATPCAQVAEAGCVAVIVVVPAPLIFTTPATTSATFVFPDV